MLALGQDEIAKYPFLADAGQYLKDKGFTLEQFGTDPDLKPLVEKAFARILVAAEGDVYKSNLTGDKVSKEAALPLEGLFISAGHRIIETNRNAHPDQAIFTCRGKTCRKIS